MEDGWLSKIETTSLVSATSYPDILLLCSGRTKDEQNLFSQNKWTHSVFVFRLHLLFLIHLWKKLLQRNQEMQPDKQTYTHFIKEMAGKRNFQAIEYIHRIYRVNATLLLFWFFNNYCWLDSWDNKKESSFSLTFSVPVRSRDRVTFASVISWTIGHVFQQREHYPCIVHWAWSWEYASSFLTERNPVSRVV